jgi:Asp-tRNA(Asn)/Glu-tRNA(Gln) amidotransferase A subunit family amidase
VTLISADDTQPGPRIPDQKGHNAVRRRTVLKSLALLGVGTNTFQRALASQAAQAGTVTVDMIKQSEWIAGLELTPDERASTARTIARSLRSFAELRKVDVGYDIPPALAFMPKSPQQPAGIRRNQARPAEMSTPGRPDSAEELAFLPVTALSALIRSRQISSMDLTKLYLERLRRFDPLLKCVVTYTDQLALKQAAKADEEIAAGHYRGPLHGIPWGAKDLIAYPGYPTTWGATPFKNRVIDEKAAVAARLEEAGAVLVAKLSLGALAMGDLWFGGRTRSPWDPRTGSSGSSAGSASAVAAGLVGFAIGSETLGSIVSPCRACGASGLRPTYGRISRHGCMTLSWSMDKLGPIARSIEDCALVLDAIHGADGLDWAAVDYPFDWPPKVSLENIKIGYIEERDHPADDREELRVLRKIGFELVPITLPDDLPIQAITLMLGTEAAAVFDEITRKHITEGLNSWPESFRNGQFVPAVEYLRAARVRTKLMRAMAERMAKVDVYVGSGQDLPITNLTGHPCAVFPMGFHDRGGRSMPDSVTLTGRLYDETTLLAVAHAFQQATGDHYKRPPLEAYLAEEQKKIDQEKSKGKDVAG